MDPIFEIWSRTRLLDWLKDQGLGTSQGLQNLQDYWKASEFICGFVQAGIKPILIICIEYTNENYGRYRFNKSILNDPDFPTGAEEFRSYMFNHIAEDNTVKIKEFLNKLSYEKKDSVF